MLIFREENIKKREKKGKTKNEKKERGASWDLIIILGGASYLIYHLIL
ncbi:unnamed protein product [Arabidopsis halleri]